MNCLVYRCCCIYLYHCAPYYFSTGQIIPYQLHQVATTSTVSEAHRVLPGSRRWRKLEKSIGKKKTRMLPFCSWFLFRGKLGQKMDYISFQQLFEHLTTNQIDFRSSKSTIQLKLTWKTEPFSAVRNAKPETQPGSQTCDVKMMLRIGIFAKAPKWQWFFSGVFGTCCRSKELMMSLVNSASKTTLGRE